MKIKWPMKAWAVVDENGFYVPTFYAMRSDADAEKRKWSHLREAKFRVHRVKISPASTTTKP